jgi:hypothetical protein
MTPRVPFNPSVLPFLVSSSFSIIMDVNKKKKQSLGQPGAKHTQDNNNNDNDQQSVYFASIFGI